MNILGDIDVLRKMDLHRKYYRKQLMDNLIPREIYQYLPPKMIKEMI